MKALVELSVAYKVDFLPAFLSNQRPVISGASFTSKSSIISPSSLRTEISPCLLISEKSKRDT